ncbi:hypothetical protein F4802DRAFT_573543 [Xylaria palmicola]|nr:hypothetical protein F4802DRAFT_573543 [Xylaria palmicola]
MKDDREPNRLDGSFNRFDNYSLEFFIDPRLRSDTAKMLESENEHQTQQATPVFAPNPTLPLGAPPTSTLASPLPGLYNLDFDEEAENDIVLPPSAYTSLDCFLASGDIQDEGERLWLIGLQAGIGLGINGVRESVLNQMQYTNSVFGRRLQSDPSDPDPYQMRMEIGKQCQAGFDLNIANRLSRKFMGNCMKIVDVIVENGLTACLPENGNAIPGTSMFFSDEDTARCHENFRKMNKAHGTLGVQPQTHTQIHDGSDDSDDSDDGQPAPFMTSFLGDVPFIAGFDMTRLEGPAALVADALKHKYIMTPQILSQQYIGFESRGGAGPEPFALHTTGKADLSGHPQNNHQAFKARHENGDSGQQTPSIKPEAEPGA